MVSRDDLSIPAVNVFSLSWSSSRLRKFRGGTTKVLSPSRKGSPRNLVVMSLLRERAVHHVPRRVGEALEVHLRHHVVVELRLPGQLGRDCLRVARGEVL